jgi:hypothetical protein
VGVASSLSNFALKIVVRGLAMSPLVIVIAVIAIILLITGGLVQSLNFLLWVGAALLILVVISFLLRSLSGRR